MDQDSLSDGGLGGGAEHNSSVVVWCFSCRLLCLKVQQTSQLCYQFLEDFTAL